MKLVTRHRLLALATSALLIGVWVAPMYRAVEFWKWAGEYFADDQTINAMSDLNFSRSILAIYAGSLTTAAVLVVFLCATRWDGFVLPLFLVVLGGFLATVSSVEQPIHLCPNTWPLVVLLLLDGSALMVGVGMFAVWKWRHRANREMSA